MAKPVTRRFGDLRVYLDTSANATPAFEMPCGFTDKSLELTADTSDVAVPDCDDPDGAIWNERDVRTRNARITGQGVLAMESSEEWRSFFLNGPRLVRVEINAPAADGGGYWQGRAVLTSWRIDGTLGDKLKSNVEMSNDGEWVWTAAAA